MLYRNSRNWTSGHFISHYYTHLHSLISPLWGMCQGCRAGGRQGVLLKPTGSQPLLSWKLKLALSKYEYAEVRKVADWIQPWPKKCPHLILSALKINSKFWPADGVVICPHLMGSWLSALKLSADTFCANPSAGQQGRPQARIFFKARA